MSKILKRLTSLLVIILMLVMVILPVSANNTQPSNILALGDSIGFGLTAVKFGQSGFNDLFALSLSSNGFALDNDCIPGYTSANLLQYANNPANENLIKNAKIMTISNGSNNLLGPVTASIVGLYGINPSDSRYQTDYDGSLLIADLGTAIQANPYPTPMQRLSTLMQPGNPNAIRLNLTLLAGVASFSKEWPKTIARIRNLAPTSEIYVNTIYNPLRVSGSSDPLYPLYLKMEAMIKSINLVITGLALKYHYAVVDVYSTFRNFRPVTFDFVNDVLTFNIQGAIVATTQLDFYHCVDPHPTPNGHQSIFVRLTSVRHATPSWYWRLPVS